MHNAIHVSCYALFEFQYGLTQVGIPIMGRPKLEYAAAACAIPTKTGVVGIPIMDWFKFGSFQNCAHSQNGCNNNTPASSVGCIFLGRFQDLSNLHLFENFNVVYEIIEECLTRFNKICHPSQRPRWQVDKEAIGLSRVQQCSPTYNPPS